MRRVLILSTTTGYQLRSFGDAAAKTGIDLMFATDRCHQLDDPWRDGAVAVRFHEEESSLRAVVEAASVRRIDGVIAVGDRPVVLAARIAQELCIAGNTVTAAAASVNKLLSRRRLANAGLPVPWFFDANVRTRISLDSRVRYPCVVKPLGLAGSRGVMRANSPSELDEATERLRALLSRIDVRAIRMGLDDVALVERFIEGREFAIEGVLTDGVVQTFAIFDKPDPLDGPFFEETIYVTPSDLDEDLQWAVIDQVQRAVDALGLGNGSVHAECRVGADGIFILEVAARPIGGLCSKVLRFTSSDSSDASLEEVLLRHAAGEDVSRFERETRASGVMMIPIPRRGSLKRVQGVDAARAVDGIEDVRITAKPDQLLETLPEAGSYLGFIFARGNSSSGVVNNLKTAHAQLQFDIAAPIPVAGI
jgi:biotin carboxylase